MTRFGVGVLLGGLVLAGARVASAEPRFVYRWVDKAGVVHLTDRLADVPEPFYSTYQAWVKEELERRQAAGLPDASSTPPQPVTVRPPPSRPPEPSLVEQKRARREGWRKLMAYWRAELLAASAALDEVDQEKALARLNPTLAQTPAVKARVAEIDKKRQVALARVEAARRMLLEQLPARARRERVPPKWLE